MLLASGGWRPERLLNALQDAGQLQGEEPQVLVVSGGETLRKGRLRAGPAPSALGIPSATGLGGFGQAACPFQAAAPPLPGLLSCTCRWDSTALVSIAWGCLGLETGGGVAGVFSHLTLEDSLEQPFLRRFWRVTSVQVWREGTVRSKHVQLFKAFCFYHLEKVQRHGRCEGLWPSPRVKRNPAPSLGLSPTGTQSQQVLPPPRPLPGGPACCPPPKPHPVSSFTPSGPRSPRMLCILPLPQDASAPTPIPRHF